MLFYLCQLFENSSWVRLKLVLGTLNWSREHFSARPRKYYSPTLGLSCYNHMYIIIIIIPSIIWGNVPHVKKRCPQKTDIPTMIVFNSTISYLLKEIWSKSLQSFIIIRQEKTPFCRKKPPHVLKILAQLVALPAKYKR